MPARAPATVPFRPNKRTSFQSNLAPLLNLYHLTPTFLPLAPSQLSPHVNHAFAPNVTYKDVPHPSTTRDLNAANSRISDQASLLDLKKSMLEVNLDLQSNFAERNSSTAWASKTGESATKSFEEGWKEAWKSGAEAPLRKRVRRTLDTLHGTVSGGQAGELVVKEKGSLAEQLRVDLADMREEARARKREEERQAEREVEEFSRSFGDDDMAELIERR